MKTSLYERHLALGAKIVDFAGWQMPLQYKGVIQEHLSVRNHAGIFDVSHMGRISILGKDAERFLDYLSTNQLTGRKDLSATYTVMPNAAGGSVDDVIVYKRQSGDYFIIVNASNRQKDLAHLQNYAQKFDVEVKDHYRAEGILAIQGPKASSIWEKMFPGIDYVKPMRFQDFSFQGYPFILSGTGYTGAGGFEIYAPLDLIPTLWDEILEKGKEENIAPIGLGARDTLRLEMGFALYGHELSEEIAPNESVSAWTIHWDNRDFLGKDKMQSLEKSGRKRSEWGILVEKGIAREGCQVFKEGKPIGVVTSGNYSPLLNQGIAIILIEGPCQEGEIVEVQIRQNKEKGRVKSLPFIKKIK